MAFLLEIGGADDAFLAINVQLQATKGATDLIALLPELVAWMPGVLASEGTVKAWTGDVFIESLLICALVDVGSTFDAFQVSCGFFKAVAVSCRCLGLLLLQELADDLAPGESFVEFGGFWAQLEVEGMVQSGVLPAVVLSNLGASWSHK